MERLVSDSGVIRVVVRELRDNIDEIPMTLRWWERRYSTEPWRAAEGIAATRSAAEDGVAGDPKLYWYSKVCYCINEGLALASFVGSSIKVDGAGKYGAPSAILLALPDNMNRDRAVLLHLSRDAFGGEEGERVMLNWAREWASLMGRKLMREVVTREWKDA